MKSLLTNIEELLPSLPLKDYHISKKYLKERNFESILEIVESDLYKAEKARLKNNLENSPDEYTATLTELRESLVEYMSYLDIPDNSNEYDYY